MKRVFLDTSGWFAALSPREFAHRQANEAYRTWISDGTSLVTTNLVVAEMQALLTRYRGTAEGLRFLDSLYQDPGHEVILVDRTLERAAVDHWLRRFSDQDLSLADAVSFELMKSLNIRSALALDDHFRLAGFSLVPAGRPPRSPSST